MRNRKRVSGVVGCVCLLTVAAVAQVTDADMGADLLAPPPTIIPVPVRSSAVSLPSPTAQADTTETSSTPYAQGERLFRGYRYAEALDALSPAMSTDPHAQKLAKTIQETSASLVKYSGPAHHIFFHSLMVRPELAFDTIGHSAAGYNMWFTTVKEFKAMLPELLKRGYVLYSIEEFVQPDPQEPGKLKPRDIWLPSGKTPLVLSIDDVNYYRYMKPDGFASRLVVGTDGRVWTEVVSDDGVTTQTRDGDVMPIVDDFVAEYPEFSWRGAKGILALTGYEGAMGYRIVPENPVAANDAATAAAKAVADVLKADGWLFATHSYTHNQYFRNGSMNLERLQYDTQKWKDYIEPVTGATNIYISPFGVSEIFTQTEYRDYLVGQGYNIFCPVGGVGPIRYQGHSVVMDRLNIDGYKMTYGRDILMRNYFDPTAILDAIRPAVPRSEAPLTPPAEPAQPQEPRRGFLFGLFSR